MRIAKYITPFLICGALGLHGCDDFLDTKPASTYSEELVWSSRSTADAFVLQTYGSIIAKFHDYATIEKFTTNSVTYNGCPDEVRELKDRYWDFGFGDFTALRNCNLIIEKVNASATLSDTDKKELIAEGKMLRAMACYYQAKHTGRFIWIDRVLTQDDEFNLPLTKTIDESYSYILKDIDEAIAGLPLTSKAGRINKNAAYAFKSEVCLTAAAYTGNEKLYQEAVDAVDAITGYSLDSEYEDMFNQDGAYSSPEIILAHYRSKDNTNCSGTPMQTIIPNQNNDAVKANGCSPLFKRDLVFECWMDHSPSQNLVDDYLVIDQATKKAVAWNETTQFKNNTESLPVTDSKIAGMAIDPKELTSTSLAYHATSKEWLNDLMYKNRDKRFYATIVYDSCEYYKETVTLCQKGNLYRTARTGGLGNSYMPVTNYLWRKGVYDIDWRVFVNVPTDYHYVIFRYGRALLNKAEALLCQAKNNPEKIAKAVETFNQTRVTHGGLPESTATTLEEAWTDYKRERRVDLAFEDDYYWSLLRWGKYGGDANSGREPGGIIKELEIPATFVEITKERDYMFIGNVGFQNDQREFRTRRYLFPIPQSVIEANSALSEKDQNPGW